jgi:glutamate synthase domain-containing protein 2
MELLNLLVVMILFLMLIAAGAFFLSMYIRSRKLQHSVLRAHPYLGWIRYFLESIGPEFRQYWFDGDTAGKPFSRADFLGVVFAAKYRADLISFGSKRDYDQPGFYIANSMFPKLLDELKADHGEQVPGKKYNILEQGLFGRKETMINDQVLRWLLHDDDVIIVGEQQPYPWRLKGLFGASATSYGSVGEHYIESTGRGAAMAGGSWMNAGEGGVSPEHLSSGADIVSQIGPGMFGFRDHKGEFSFDEFRSKAAEPSIKAFELKLGQGAKIRGGHLEGRKVTEKIAAIRKVPIGQTVDSPNRFSFLRNEEDMLKFVRRLQIEGGKPVGIKIVVGDPLGLDTLFRSMIALDVFPDFITVDGGEGGTGATSKAMADGMGLPLIPALIALDDAARRNAVRGRFRIFASGKLITADKVAIALAAGADCVNSARGFMLANGCIMAMQCHTGRCPVGITTTDPKYQAALAVEEKMWRVMNYIIQLRQELFALSAACGLDSPRKLRREHVVFKNEYGKVTRLSDLFPHPKPVSAPNGAVESAG